MSGVRADLAISSANGAALRFGQAKKESANETSV
jgi:hypothetical protein